MELLPDASARAPNAVAPEPVACVSRPIAIASKLVAVLSRPIAIWEFSLLRSTSPRLPSAESVKLFLPMEIPPIVFALLN